MNAPIGQITTPSCELRSKMCAKPEGQCTVHDLTWWSTESVNTKCNQVLTKRNWTTCERACTKYEETQDQFQVLGWIVA